MSGTGQPGSGEANSSRQLATWMPPAGYVTPEEYNANMARVRQMREALAHFEHQNEVGLSRYSEQEQLLMQRVEAGREAERLLAQMSTTSTNRRNPPALQRGEAAPYVGHPSHQPPAAAASGSGTYNQPVIHVSSKDELAQHSNPAYYRDHIMQQQQHAYPQPQQPVHSFAQNGVPVTAPMNASMNMVGQQQSWATNGPITQGPVAYSGQPLPPDFRRDRANTRGQPGAQVQGYDRHPQMTMSPQQPPVNRGINQPSSSATSSPVHPAGASVSYQQSVPPMNNGQNAQQSGRHPRRASDPRSDPYIREQVQNILNQLKSISKDSLKEVLRLVLKNLQPKLFPNGVPDGYFLRSLRDDWSESQKKVMVQISDEISEKLDKLPLNVVHLTLRHISSAVRGPDGSSPPPEKGGPISPVEAPQTFFQGSSSAAFVSQASSTMLPPNGQHQPMSSDTSRLPKSKQNIGSHGDTSRTFVQPSQPTAGSMPGQDPITLFNGQTSPSNQPQLTSSISAPLVPSPFTLGPQVSANKRWTPAMADKTRLARDIMRSLGSSHHLSTALQPSISEPSISDVKGKRKAVDPDVQFTPDKRQRSDMPQVTSTLPITSSTSQLPPDAPSIAVLVDSGESQQDDMDVVIVDEQSGPTPDAEQEQVDQLPDENMEIYAEIKTPGALQLEVEAYIAHDEPFKELASQTYLPQDNPISELAPAPSSPELHGPEIVPAGPPSSHVSTSPAEPPLHSSPPISSPPPPDPTELLPEVEQTLSQSYQDHVEPSSPSKLFDQPLLSVLAASKNGPSPFVGKDSSLNESLQRFPTRSQPSQTVENTSKGSPSHIPSSPPLQYNPQSKIPLFLPLDDEDKGSESSDVVLLTTPPPSFNAKRRSHGSAKPATKGSASQDRFILNSSLLAGPELPGPSRSMRSTSLRTSQPSQNLAQRGAKHGSSSQSSSRGSSETRAKASGMYVHVPPLPRWAMTIKLEAKRAEKQKQRSRSTSESVVPETPPDAHAMDAEDEETKRNREVDERAAADLSYHRLHESRCQWAGCDAILSSAERLASHASSHAQEKDALGGFICDWDGCSRQFHNSPKLVQHLRNHALYPLYCAYQGCNESFPSSGALVKHHKLPRHVGDTIRPQTTLIKPTPSDVELPQLSVVPAYLCSPIVTQHSMSRKLHDWLGAKVAANIRCYTRDRTRSNAAVPSRASRRLAEKIPVMERTIQQDPDAVTIPVVRPQTDQYESWRVPRYRRSKPCSNIPSIEVTRLVHGGFIATGHSEKEANAELAASYDPEDMDVDVDGEWEPDEELLVPDSKMEEEQGLSTDGQTSLSASEAGDDGLGEGGDDMSRNVPSVSAAEIQEVDGSIRSAAQGPSTGSSDVTGEVPHQDGDQETQQQGNEYSQPTWTTLPETDDKRI